MKTENIWFSLETATRPVLLWDNNSQGVQSSYLPIHEISHDYFGNAIRLASWQDLWLNEGFATWTEWYWGSQRGMTSFVDEVLDNWCDNENAWKYPLNRPANKHQMWDQVYWRGAVVLETLRREIGNSNFHQLLRLWYSSSRFQARTTADFQNLAEEVSGQDLDGFFNKWMSAGVQIPEWFATWLANNNLTIDSICSNNKRIQPKDRTFPYRR